MFADGVLPLVESGVVNGRNKVTDPGKMRYLRSLWVLKRLRLIDDNPGVLMMDVAYTKRPQDHI